MKEEKKRMKEMKKNIRKLFAMGHVSLNIVLVLRKVLSTINTNIHFKFPFFKINANSFKLNLDVHFIIKRNKLFCQMMQS